jgi:heptosyltransferase-2
VTRALSALAPRVIGHDPHPASGEHAARWLARAVFDLVGEPSQETPVCEPTAEERAQAAEWRRRLPPVFLAVHPGSGSPAKNWPGERFAAMLQALGATGEYLLVEGPADDRAAAPLRSGAAAVARSLPPRVLGALLSSARAFIGNDSGVSHLAAAWGAPTVVLFGPTDPTIWAPVGPRVLVVRSRDGTMEGIGVEEVAAALDLRGAMSPAGGRPSG